MSKARGRSRRQGFTLIDALVACVLLTGGLVLVAGALEGLALADSATGARVQAKELAVSVLAELKGLPTENLFQYSRPADKSGEVQVELVNAAGQIVALPAQGVDVKVFPPKIEARVKATCKNTRGHVFTVQAVGFLTGRGAQP